MGKKKKKDHHPPKSASAVSKKSHEPTLMELAFRRGEEKLASCTKKIDNCKKLAPLPPPVPAAPSIETKSKIPQPPPRVKTQSSGSSVISPQKETRAHIPPSAIKISNIRAAQPATKKAPLSATAPSLSIKQQNPPVLGIRPVPEKKLVLNLGATENGRLPSALPPPPKKTQPWKTTGASQVHDGSFKEESDLVIGFDFGTSSSKLVIRDSVRQTAYAVPFGPFACPGNTYLIPTKIFIDAEGGLSLSKGIYSYGNLKTHLMDDPEKCIYEATNLSITASELAAGYMAMVIRHARAWFLKETESIYKKTDIQWWINVGIPSKNYDDTQDVGAFRYVAMAAWGVSRLDTAITIFDVKKYLQKAKRHVSTQVANVDAKGHDSFWLHPDFVNTHPEVIMEVVGYARSTLRTPGLHLLIDVGATTLDAATFIIHSRDGEDIYPLLATDVQRLGTMALHARRMQSLKDSVEKCLQGQNAIDSTGPLPGGDHYRIKDAGQLDIKECDNCFFRECRAIIGEVVRHTRNHRDPLAEAWGRGLPVFICGGGGRLSLYREMIEKLGSQIAANISEVERFVVKEIPKPEKLEAPELSPKEYDRLAVAYGLSFTPDEIGEVIPKSKLSDIDREESRHNYDDRFVNKDMC